MSASPGNLARQTTPEETAVHHTISYYLTEARLADVRHHTRRAALVRAARRRRPDPPRITKRSAPGPRRPAAAAARN